MKLILILTIFVMLSTTTTALTIDYELEDNTIFENQTLTHVNYNPAYSSIGIAMYCNNSIIRNCTLIGYYCNIKIIGNNNIVENNTLVAGCDGVQVSFNSRNNTIRNNRFYRNLFGICIWYNSSHTYVYGNKFISSLNVAIDIRNTSDLAVYDNEFVGNFFCYIFEEGKTLVNISIYNNSYYNNTGITTDWDELWILQQYHLDNWLRLFRKYSYVFVIGLALLIIVHILCYIKLKNKFLNQSKIKEKNESR